MTLARAFRSLESPAVPLTSAALADWLNGGRTKAGVSVSEQRVHGLPAYYRAMAIRSGVEAALPLKVYKRGTRELMSARTVLDSPNPSQKTPFAFRQTMKFNEIAWGNAYARKVRNGADVVVQTWPIHPSRCRTEQVDITERNREGKLFLVRDSKGVEHRWTSWEIFHVPFMSPTASSGSRPSRRSASRSAPQWQPRTWPRRCSRTVPVCRASCERRRSSTRPAPTG